MKAKSFTQFIFESEEKWLKTDTIPGGRRRGPLGHVQRPGPSRIRIDGTTKKYEILKFIYTAGEWGRSYTEILRVIVENLVGDTYKPTEDRGRYGTYLIGTRERHGLLSQYWTKKQGRWVISDPILIEHFDKIQSEGKIKMAGEGTDPEVLDSLKTLRELGITINPWEL